MVQAETNIPGHMQLGANFHRELLVDCMSLGTAVMGLLIGEITFLYDDCDDWQDEMREIREGRNAWFEAEHSNGSNVDGS